MRHHSLHRDNVKLCLRIGMSSSCDMKITWTFRQFNLALVIFTCAAHQQCHNNGCDPLQNKIKLDSLSWKVITEIFFLFCWQQGGVKRQISPITSPRCLEGSRKLRFTDYVTMAQDGGKVVSLTHRALLLPANTPGTHFCLRLSRPQGHSALGRNMSMKNSNDTSWNRTSDLPICSTGSKVESCRSKSNVYLGVSIPYRTKFHNHLSLNVE